MKKNNINILQRHLPGLLFAFLLLGALSGYGHPFRFISTSASLQQQLSGRVTDDQAQPIPGAYVLIKNARRGTLTEDDGSFKITAQRADTLVVSYMGFQGVEIPVGQQTEFSIRLKPNVTSLGEVVVNAGYYKVSQKERTGSIARLEAETIEKQPVNNPLGAMQGHLAGVNIVQNTGVPGAGYSIEIRGQNFIKGNTQPLYIIDGVPYDAGSLADPYLSQGINQGNVSPLNALDPTTIGSIEVLKDADATAIYGSRGANGVVLITTKQGKPGKLRTQVGLTTSWGKVTHFLDLMNTRQYLAVRREALANSGYDVANPPTMYAWPDLSEWDQTRETDWQEVLIGGTSYRHHAKVSVSGGSEQTRFLLGGSFLKETTVFPGDSRYHKASVFQNLNHRSSNERFQLGVSASYTREDNRLPRTDLTSQAYRLPPNAPSLYEEEGELNWEEGTWDNPLAQLEESYGTKTTNLVANTTMSYRVWDGWEVKANLGYTCYQLNSERTLPHSARNPRLPFTPQNYSSIALNTSQRASWIIEPQVNWTQEFGKTKLELLVGTTFQNRTTEQLTVSGRGFPNNSLIHNIAAANTVEVVSNFDSDYRYQALFGRLNLNYDDRYIANLTGRRDGSSRFGPGKQFGNFGALGLAWLFSNERFIKAIPWWGYGKLRGSYGVTGSDNIGDYRYLNTYEVTGTQYDGTTILAPTGVYNPEFGWETNKKLEAALELGFFNNRLQLSTAWYRNRSSNQLIGVPLAATTGFSSLTANFGATVENTGWEWELSSVHLKGKQWEWRTNFNFTLPQNKLRSFPGLEASTFANQYIIGEPLSMIRLYHALGVNPETGLYEFEDYNNDGEITPLEDKGYIEDFSPEFYGGLGNTLSYRDFSLSFFLQFKKQKAYNFMSVRANPGAMLNGPVSLLERWQNPGDQTGVMRASFNEGALSPVLQNYTQSSGAVSDASFIRLRNIDLSYTLPKGSVGEATSLRLYVQGQNLLTFTDFEGPDPEQPYYSILPPLRQFTLGVEMGF